MRESGWPTSRQMTALSDERVRPIGDHIGHIVSKGEFEITTVMLHRVVRLPALDVVSG